MRAVVYTEYGPPDVLQLTGFVTPIPKTDEVLVEVSAASIKMISKLSGILKKDITEEK